MRRGKEKKKKEKKRGKTPATTAHWRCAKISPTKTTIDRSASMFPCPSESPALIGEGEGGVTQSVLAVRDTGGEEGESYNGSRGGRGGGGGGREEKGW